jgi:two-component system sensor histidine kinase DctS
MRLPYALQRALWLLPLLAALLLMLGVLGWAYRAERDDAKERRATLIADALSSEAQLRGRLDIEKARLDNLAQQLSAGARSHASLAEQAQVVEGLRGIWLSVTWLDADKRIIAHAPQVQARGPHPNETIEGPGLSAHLIQSVGDETLVVRYTPALLLQKGLPWWLTRKYNMQLVDASEHVIASLDAPSLHPIAQASTESYQVNVGTNMPGAYLELIMREPVRPFWQTVPWGLMAGFLLLMLVATWLLRQQMQLISRAKRAWRTEAAWRRAMEDSALVGLRARDIQGRILYVNRTFCDMVGLPAERLVGMLPPMPYWPKDALDEVMQRHQRNLAGQAPREGYESLWCHQNGSQLNVMVFESPLIGAQGVQIGWMGSIIDITAHKQLQARQRQQAEAQARQARLSTLGEIASALAHQLNQPLTAIMGYNMGLQRMLSQDSPHNTNTNTNTDHTQTMRNALQQQGEQAAQAGRIVQRIRAFLTRHAPQPEECDLLRLARQAADLLAHDIRQQRIQLQWDYPHNLASADADPILVEQVLINLLRNAIDALMTHAATLPASDPAAATLAPAPYSRSTANANATSIVRITIAHHNEHSVQLAIEDNGPGLQGRTIAQLSEPFYSTKPDGMGMGLAICRSVIEAHHGTLAGGQSSLGGAKLSFTLPMFHGSPHT